MLRIKEHYLRISLFYANSHFARINSNFCVSLVFFQVSSCRSYDLERRLEIPSARGGKSIIFTNDPLRNVQRVQRDA